MHVVPGVYLRKDPKSAAPVVFDIPRSGAEFPRWFRTKASVADVQKSVSAYVEELYAGVPENGATWLYACFPNIVIDANRHEADIDPAQIDGAFPGKLEPSEKTRDGIGLIPTVAAGKVQLYDGPLPAADILRRLDELYRPYHGELARLLREAHAAHGVAYHLSCHSMPAMPAATAPDAGKRRSDFDLGDRRGTTCEPGLVEVVAACLKGFGYKVTSNAHFIGAESVRKHAAPEKGFHSLQIEMNRSLYMDEATREKGPQFAQVRDHMTALAGAIAGYAKSRK